MLSPEEQRRVDINFRRIYQMLKVQTTPEETLLIEALLHSIHNDTLAQRYLAKTRRYVQAKTHIPSLTSPLDALGEKMINSAAFLDPRVPFLGDPPWIQRITYATIMQEIAEVFLWKTEMVNEAIAVDVPQHIISADILRVPCMYWTFADAVSLDDGTLIDWVLLLSNQPSKDHPSGGFTVITPNTNEDRMSGWAPLPSVHLRGITVDYGAEYPTDPAAFKIKSVLQLLAFLNSPYVEIAQAEQHKGAAKEYKQRHNKSLPEVSTIHLRSRAPRDVGAVPRAVSLGSDINEVQKRHPGQTGHWYVRRHIRKQWYAREGAHKLIWIPSHMRGDPTQPLKRKVYKVAR